MFFCTWALGFPKTLASVTRMNTLQTCPSVQDMNIMFIACIHTLSSFTLVSVGCPWRLCPTTRTRGQRTTWETNRPRSAEQTNEWWWWRWWRRWSEWQHRGWRWWWRYPWNCSRGVQYFLMNQSTTILWSWLFLTYIQASVSRHPRGHLPICSQRCKALHNFYL